MKVLPQDTAPRRRGRGGHGGEVAKSQDAGEGRFPPGSLPSVVILPCQRLGWDFRPPGQSQRLLFETSSLQSICSADPLSSPELSRRYLC